jgi:riboflavin kinase
MQTLDIRRDTRNSVNDNPIHLPDRQFFDWCTTNYLVNRGVFNVIDSWFYDYGLIDIVKRRKVMVQYLKHLRVNGFYNEKKLFLQFGKGGVKESLYSFTDKRYRNSKGDFIENKGQ